MNQLTDIQIMGQKIIDQINAKADAIIDDIRFNHWESMLYLDWLEEQQINERIIVERIAPHSNIKDWWRSLHAKQVDEWYALHQEYQFTSSIDELVNDQPLAS